MKLTTLQQMNLNLREFHQTLPMQMHPLRTKKKMKRKMLELSTHPECEYSHSVEHEWFSHPLVAATIVPKRQVVRPSSPSEIECRMEDREEDVGKRRDQQQGCKKKTETQEIKRCGIEMQNVTTQIVIFIFTTNACQKMTVSETLLQTMKSNQ